MSELPKNAPEEAILAMHAPNGGKKEKAEQTIARMMV
jgi:hypothetical protein